jgi:hypothetical protein
MPIKRYKCTICGGYIDCHMFCDQHLLPQVAELFCSNCDNPTLHSLKHSQVQTSLKQSKDMDKTATTIAA